jgi:hypothetical protein
MRLSTLIGSRSEIIALIDTVAVPTGIGEGVTFAVMLGAVESTKRLNTDSLLQLPSEYSVRTRTVCCPSAMLAQPIVVLVVFTENDVAASSE